MKFKMLSAAVAAALLSTSASAVDFNGYARSGVGVSDDGDQKCEVQKQKVGRLGNECDTYAEMTLGQEVHNNDGKLFKIKTTLAYNSDQTNDWEGAGANAGSNDPDMDANFAIREIFATATGVLSFAPEATVWAGKRFYQRHDVHITDFYYWDVSGPGAGIEGIKIGDGALNFSWTRSDRQEGFINKNGTLDTSDDTGTARNQNIFDVRYTGLALNAANSLDFGAMYAMVNEDDAQEADNRDVKDGVLLTAELTSSVLGGFNKLVGQFGTEGYAHALRYFGAGNWYGSENSGDDGTAFRIIDWGVVPAGDKVDIGYSVNYASYDRDSFDTAHEYMNIVVRPTYKWSDYTKTILEVGYYNADDDSWGEEEKSKVTLAQAISAGNGFWARPEIRVFATYVKDHKDGTFSNGEDNQLNFGVQMEAWW
jgi:maltoporin